VDNVSPAFELPYLVSSWLHRCVCIYVHSDKEVFPTLDIVGWYSIGEEPTGDDLGLHKQVSQTHMSSLP
jgi:hypothetical protein